MITRKTIDVMTDAARFKITNCHSLVVSNTADAVIDVTIEAPEANVSVRLKAKQVSDLIDALRYVRYE